MKNFTRRSIKSKLCFNPDKSVGEIISTDYKVNFEIKTFDL